MMDEKNQHRYAAMAANSFSVDRSKATDMLTSNLVEWLIESSPNKASLHILLVQVPTGNDRPDFPLPHVEGVSRWFADHYDSKAKVQAGRLCDYEQLTHCLQNTKPTLVIISDFDYQNLGTAGLKDALPALIKAKIPIIFASYARGMSELAKPIYEYMGISGKKDYWGKHRIANFSLVQALNSENNPIQKIKPLLHMIQAGSLQPRKIENCDTNFLNCANKDFIDHFKNGADILRNFAIEIDKNGINPFAPDADQLIASLLLLTDKLRTKIDYPIKITDTKAWGEAMLADWMISYARHKNIAQPDLGDFIIDQAHLTKDHHAHYHYPDTLTEARTITVPYKNQWTTTGWYALPGKTIKLTQLSDEEVTAKIKLNHHKSNTNRAYETDIYHAPLELSQQRLTLVPGQPLTFSSPYGGPIYLYLGSDNPSSEKLSIKVLAENVAKHPTITDFDNAAQIAAFKSNIQNTELPHIDLKTGGAEMHLRKDRFLDAMNNNEGITHVGALLQAIDEDHIKSVYTLAGFKIQGKSLSESLPEDVKAICTNLFGANDCYDEDWHQRKIIQHANYGQNAHCGAGCSGNPWDSGSPIEPFGWLDNHEFGHNLQTPYLNVHYVANTQKNNWPSYSSRAGENSNNIFPYWVKWKTHRIRNSNIQVINDDHANQNDLFFAYQSDILKLKNTAGQRVVLDANCNSMDTGNRYQGPWQSNEYATHNSYRMTFYLQLFLRTHNQVLATGKLLDNGFHLITLMYLHSRIFEHYAQNEQTWNANKTRLGFDLFPYNGHSTYGGYPTIATIPGNDFLLVSLSKITKKDWRPYFDMFGLRYSDLAQQQVQAHGGAPVPVGMYVLDTNMPSKNLTDGLTFMTFNNSIYQKLPNYKTPSRCPVPPPLP